MIRKDNANICNDMQTATTLQRYNNMSRKLKLLKNILQLSGEKMIQKNTKNAFTKIFLFAIMFLCASVFVQGTVDLAIKNLTATQEVKAYSPIQLQFKIVNVGTESVATGLQVQMYTEDHPEGLGIHDLLIANIPGYKAPGVEPTISFTVYKADGTTRTELVQERMMNLIEVTSQGEIKATQPVESIMLNPGEYVILQDSFYFRDQAAVKPGEHKIGLKFMGLGGVYSGGTSIMNDRTGKKITVVQPSRTYYRGEKIEETFENNGEMVTVIVQKRTPLVEGEGYNIGEGNVLLKNEYFIHDYWEYHEDGKLCATIESKEICVLEKYDGENFPFTVDGKTKKLSWSAKIFFMFGFKNDDFLYKKLSDFVNVNIDGAHIYLTGGPGLLVKMEK